MLVQAVALVCGGGSVQLPDDLMKPMYSHLPHYVSVNVQSLKCNLHFIARLSLINLFCMKDAFYSDVELLKCKDFNPVVLVEKRLYHRPASTSISIHFVVLIKNNLISVFALHSLKITVWQLRL